MNDMRGHQSNLDSVRHLPYVRIVSDTPARSRHLTDEERAQQGELVREMIRQMQRYLRGELPGRELGQWAAQEARRAHATIRLHGEASTELGSLVDHDEGGEVRRGDVEEYVRWLTRGDGPRMQQEPLVRVKTRVEQLAEQLGLRETRWWLDGLGLCATLRFVSPATGRHFAALSMMPGYAGSEQAPGADIRLAHEPDHESLVDLFDTLSIDLDDTAYLTKKLDPEALPRWRLVRQDDNGHRFVLQTFTGLAKAREHLRRFEALHHKQTYWLEGA